MSISKKQTLSKNMIGAMLKDAAVGILNMYIGNVNHPQDKPTSGTFEVPSLIETFRGRNEKLNELKFKFIKNKQRNVVITGHGGIGKTELAKQLGHTMLSEGLVKQVMWFNAERMTYDKKDVIERFNEFKGRACLCIYDNCVETIKIKEYMPPAHYNFFILLTSQEKVPGYEEVMLNTLSLEAALEVIKAVLITDYIEEVTPQYKQLADLVSYVPLGLQVVSGYIKMLITGGMDPSDITKCVQTLKEDVTNIKIYPQLNNPYDKTIYSVTKASVDRLFAAEHVLPKTINLTQYILYILTYLNPNDIFCNILSDIIKQIPNFSCTESDIENSLHFISNYNLITYDNNQVKLHRLMQLSLKHYFEEERSREINEECYSACILWLCIYPSYQIYHRDHVMRFAEQNIGFIFNFYKTYSQIKSIFLQLLVKCSCIKCISHIAVHRGNFQQMINNYELLYFAVKYGTVAMVKKLLNIGAHVHRKGSHMWGSRATPLFLAAAEGNLDMMQLLVNHGADPTVEDNNGDLPLHEYCSRANPVSKSDMLKALKLLDINENWHITPGSGGTLLHVVCRCGRNVHLLRHLLHKYSLNIDSQDKYGDTVMHVLCRNMDTEDEDILKCLQVLMQYKPNLQIQNYNKETCEQILKVRSKHRHFDPKYYSLHMTP